MFWKSRASRLDAKTFIIDKKKKYSFTKIFNLSDNYFKEVESRSLILIQAQRDIDTIVSYLGSLRNDSIPLLVDTNLSLKSFSKILDKYNPDYFIFENDQKFKNYNFYKKIGKKYIFKIKKKNLIKLNDNLCMVMPTSGSMGDTKCVRISKDNINCVTKSIVKYLMMNNSRISISSLPLNYIYGLSVLNCSLESRSKFVINNSSWIERNFWIDVESNKVTDLSGVPFMFQALKRLNISKKILDNLKCVNQAGGRLEPNLTEFFVNFFQSKNINFYTMYGATEASPRISYVPPEKAKEKIGSVGIPIDIGKVYTDNRDKKSLGEIIYEGKNVCMGYAFTRNELALNDINKGILKTGDIGYIDNDGYLTITGRKKRFVKIYGVSVNLDKIESELKKISEDLAVIGKDDLILILLANSMKNHSDLKNELKNNINFPLRAIKIKNVGTIYKNSSNKLDYAKMNKKYL